jgi:hypothetical protein
MKKLFILGMAAFLVFGFTSWASAAFTNPYTMGPASAQFFAVDNLGTDGDNLVTLTNLSYTPGYTLQYSVGSDVWNTIAAFNNFTVSTTEHFQLVQLRLFSNTDPVTYITTATMTFSGQYEKDSPLYNSVQFLFGDAGSYKFAFETPAGTDHVSPVPLPGALWLFGAGLIGLVGVRRKIRR